MRLSAPVIVLGLAFLVATGAASAEPVGKPGGVSVTLTESGGGTRFLEGRFRVNASLDRARDVLSDYENLPKFVSSMRSSRVLRREGRMTLVEQIMTGRAGPFRKKIIVNLEIYESPTSISFRDVLGHSFRYYEGSWGLLDYGDEVEVIYELRVQPAFSAPRFMADGAFRRSVADLLSQVRDQIAAHP